MWSREIKQNALAYFQAQGRIVTKEDYITRTYAMNAKYGGVAKAYIVQDEQLNIPSMQKETSDGSNIFVDERNLETRISSVEQRISSLEKICSHVSLSKKITPFTDSEVENFNEFIKGIFREEVKKKQYKSMDMMTIT